MPRWSALRSPTVRPSGRARTRARYRYLSFRDGDSARVISQIAVSGYLPSGRRPGSWATCSILRRQGRSIRCVPSKCRQRPFSSKWSRFGPLPSPTAMPVLVPIRVETWQKATAASDLRRHQPFGQVVGSRSCNLLLLPHARRSRHPPALSGTSACAPP